MKGERSPPLAVGLLSQHPIPEIPAHLDGTIRDLGKQLSGRPEREITGPDDLDQRAIVSERRPGWGRSRIPTELLVCQSQRRLMQRKRRQSRMRQGDRVCQDVRDGESQSGSKDGQRAVKRKETSVDRCYARTGTPFTIRTSVAFAQSRANRCS